MIKKNLAIIFSTIVIDGSNIEERSKEYAACYKQLLRIIPNNFDIIFVDNSVSSIEEIQNLELQEILLKNKCYLTQQNKGLRNKGVGELSMLCEISEKLNFFEYEIICYCTGRKFFTCPYPFEKADLLEKSALVSNPDYMFLDGTLLVSDKTMFNDMFFAMKSETMTNFIKYTEPKLLWMERYMVNSEKNLYDFIHENHVEFEFLNFLGLVRSDKMAMPEKSIYHIC